jgi:hypothetical protein
MEASPEISATTAAQPAFNHVLQMRKLDIEEAMAATKLAEVTTAIKLAEVAAAAETAQATIAKERLALVIQAIGNHDIGEELLHKMITG